MSNISIGLSSLFMPYEQELSQRFRVGNLVQVETAAHGPYRSVCQIWGQAWTMQFESFVNVENRGLGVNFQSNHAAELKFIDGDTYHMIMVENPALTSFLICPSLLLCTKRELSKGDIKLDYYPLPL